MNFKMKAVVVIASLVVACAPLTIGLLAPKMVELELDSVNTNPQPVIHMSGPAGDIQVFTQTTSPTSPLEFGFINSTTGEFTPSPKKLLFPPTPQSCEKPSWHFGGTHGQTSAYFLQNRSLYFLGQLLCDQVPTEIIQLSTFINNYVDPNDQEPIQLRAGPRFNSTTHLIANMDRWNFAWDWVCNFIVLAPKKEDVGTVFETLMVSEYDGAVRPQKNFFVEPKGSRMNGWTKVDGLGAMDFDGESTGWPFEGNCGETCVQYVLESQYVNGVEMLPRRLIGRMFHTGKLASNVSDSIPAKTMSYHVVDNWLLPEYTPSAKAYFTGVGVCCEKEWCSKECVGKDGDVVLFGYRGGDAEMVLLATIAKKGVLSDSDIEETANLGVQLMAENFYSPASPVFASVFVNKAVMRFEMKNGADGSLAAKHASTSPPVKVSTPVIWVPSSMD